jgi:two-component system KDP operon response regulator KdpE
MNRVLVVEDDHVLRRALGVALRHNGFSVVEVGTAAAARAAVRARRCDAVLLDLGLPDADGLDLVAELRAGMAGPIIVVSARRDQADKVVALDRGADDYVTKPFGLPELLARIRAVTRRAGIPSVVTTTHLQIDLDHQAVTDNGVEVNLSPTEWAVLALLARAGGTPIPPEEILAKVWADAEGAHRGYVKVYINTLRRKLEPDPGHPCCLLSRAGRGYLLACTVP